MELEIRAKESPFAEKISSGWQRETITEIEKVAVVADLRSDIEIFGIVGRWVAIAGSEAVCLDLIDFALESRLNLGVHYCSLENKHSGQIYQQNSNHALFVH